jgi:hypothetical protein
MFILRASLQVQPPSFSPGYVLDTMMEHAFAEAIEVKSFGVWPTIHVITLSLKLRLVIF